MASVILFFCTRLRIELSTKKSPTKTVRVFQRVMASNKSNDFTPSPFFERQLQDLNLRYIQNIRPLSKRLVSTSHPSWHNGASTRDRTGDPDVADPRLTAWLWMHVTAVPKGVEPSFSGRQPDIMSRYTTAPDGRNYWLRSSVSALSAQRSAIELSSCNGGQGRI